MACDMCGKDGRLFKVLVEGVQMGVCKDCSRFGKPIRMQKLFQPRKLKTFHSEPKKERIQSVVSNCGSLIKAKREKLGLKQEELAKKLNEKESIMQKIESGHFKPSLELARKLERFLRIRLIMEEKDEYTIEKKKIKAEGLTIGDFITIKTK